MTLEALEGLFIGIAVGGFISFIVVPWLRGKDFCLIDQILSLVTFVAFFALIALFFSLVVTIVELV